MAEPLWTPSAERIAGTGLTRFIEQEVRGRWNADPRDFAELHRWSITEKERFWQSVWSFGGVIGDGPGDEILLDGEGMRGARWFPGARLNFAENLLGRRDGADALVFRGEDRVARTLTFGELHDLVSRLAQALEAAGVKEGDRVAGYLPNIPEAIAAMLAAASIGATWSSCSPDFGAAGVVDRFGQIEPTVLFCTDGYYYNGKWIDMFPRTAEALERLPSVSERIVIPYGGGAADPSPLPGARSLDDFVSGFAPGEIAFRRLPFNHPLYILFSSGTTGVPKCIVHGAGGTLLQHLKEHRLHSDIGAGDRAFYFTTLGWMMWNWLVSGLASGATLLLYDGSPFHPGPEALFDFADAAGMTHFGTSAKYIDAIKNAELEPVRSHDLASLRAMMSTGSPLVEESFDYVYRSVKPDICLSSISGGTDIVSCFVLGNPNGPVRRGEIQAFGLGMDVGVYDADGRPVTGEKGELVCASPFPSMPVMFWNDPDGEKYRKAYFARFENVWCHGDYAEVTGAGHIPSSGYDLIEYSGQQGALGIAEDRVVGSHDHTNPGAENLATMIAQRSTPSEPGSSDSGQLEDDAERPVVGQFLQVKHGALPADFEAAIHAAQAQVVTAHVGRRLAGPVPPHGDRAGDVEFAPLFGRHHHVGDEPARA